MASWTEATGPCLGQLVIARCQLSPPVNWKRGHGRSRSNPSRETEKRESNCTFRSGSFLCVFEKLKGQNFWFFFFFLFLHVFQNVSTTFISICTSTSQVGQSFVSLKHHYELWTFPCLKVFSVSSSVRLVTLFRLCASSPLASVDSISYAAIIKT